MKFECHGHIMADGNSYNDAAALHEKAPDIRHIRTAFKALQACDVGYFRDGGDRFGVSIVAKKLAPQYEIDYVTAGFIICREGYYGAMYGFSYRDMAGARELILRAKSLGADFIKTTVSGMLDFGGDGGVMGPSTGYAELHELVNIANGEGMRVMAHCNGVENIKNSLRAGVSSLEHGFWADDECVALLGETGAIWVPTCAPAKNVLGCGKFNDATLKNILEHQYEMLKKASDLGVLIASGSDCGAHLVPHGKGTDDEYAILSSLGIDTTIANKKLAALFRRMR